MSNVKDTGYLRNIVAYDASDNITLPANLTVTGTIIGYVPTSRTITINGTSLDLSADRSYSITSMIYPSAGIPVSTGTAWGTSITDNSANWNTAYGWGNHASGGYLTSLTDTLSSVTGRGNTTTSSVTIGSSTAPVGKLTVDLANTNYTNTGGAGAHLLMNNTSTTGQTVVSSIINGSVVAKWRTDYVGNISWVAGGSGSHDFYTGGDFGTGTTKLSIKNNGNIQMGTASLNGSFTDNGYRLEVLGTMRVTGQLTLGSTITNGTYTYTLPSATGTLALTSQLSSGTVTSVAALNVITAGTDLSSSVANPTTTPVITLQVPTASATARGVLSSADWTTFNGKESVLTFSSPLVRTTNTISIPVATTSVNGYLSSTDWTTFNNKASTASLANYLPLAGGTMSGVLNGNGSGNFYIYNYGRIGLPNAGRILYNNGTGANMFFGEIASSVYGITPNLYTDTPAISFDLTNTRVGVGTASPGAKLEVAASGAAAEIRINSNNTADNNPSLSFYSAYSSASERNWGFRSSVYAVGDFVLFQSASAGASPFAGSAKLIISAIGTATFSGIITGQNNIYQTNAAGSIASNIFSSYNGGATVLTFQFPTSGSVAFNNGTDKFTISNTGAATFSSTISAGGNITSVASSGFIGAYSTNPANDAGIGAYWTGTSGLEIKYNPNSAVGYIQSLYQLVSGQAFGDIHFRQNVGGTLTTRMIIKNDGGNVGIGTTSPSGKFHVDHGGTYNLGLLSTFDSLYVSTTKFGRPSTSSNFAITYDIAGAEIAYLKRSYTSAQLRFDRDTTTDMIISGTGNVGIGTTSPAYKLSVAGTINAGYILLGDNNNNANNTIEYVNGTNSTTYREGHIQYYSSGYLSLCYGGGYVQVGHVTSLGAYKLQVTGAIYATADITAYSDISVKNNIRPIENALLRVTKSRGVLYDRTDIDTKNNIGFIAQELEEQFPELISTNTDGTKGVKYQNAVAILFEAIKEQQTQIETLENKLNQLKK
jgi:hypothetical protein